MRLAERPLAERARNSDDPGLEETIWIQRLSPCHGLIRSVLFQDLGINYGDMILFDGAPITEHAYGDRNVPVFPHLATLHRSHYQIFDFTGTQEAARQIRDIELEGDVIIYSHAESSRPLCAGCWGDPDLDHEHGATVDHHVVIGRIAAPADVEPGELVRQIDAALAERPPCRIYAPGLCEAAGLAERAAVDRRRFNMIKGN